MSTLLLLSKNILLEFSLLCGTFLVAAVALSLLSRWTNNVFRQFAYPNLGMYLFGSIGVPVHEFSHALFCKLFLHQIDDIKWFDHKARNGAHGSVTHLYNPWNLYHRIGHFFIGLGPILLAPLLLALLFYLLVPGGHVLLDPQFFSISDPWKKLVFLCLSVSKQKLFSSVGFYIFLYLAICISSQMELSEEDVRQTLQGIVPILLVMVGINLIAICLGLTWHHSIAAFGFYLVSVTGALFIFAGVLSLLNLVMCSLTFSLINGLLGRRTINPFRQN